MERISSQSDIKHHERVPLFELTQTRFRTTVQQLFNKNLSTVFPDKLLHLEESDKITKSDFLVNWSSRFGEHLIYSEGFVMGGNPISIAFEITRLIQRHFSRN